MRPFRVALALVIVAFSTQIVRGFLMGLADLVPGVSGGTIALVLGIYERLIRNVRVGAGALARLVRLDGHGFVRKFKSVEWSFLLPLLGGIGIAIVSLAGVLDTQLEERPEVMSALFFGLIGASIYVSLRLVRKLDTARILVLAASSIASFWLLGLRGGEVEDPALLMVLAAGAIAICAMILPGVSGSFILLMLGMYEYMVASVDERDMAVIAVFGFGAIVGLASFSTLLNWLLKSYHDTLLVILIGVMVGSLRVLWPWPADTLGIEQVDLASPEVATRWPALLAAVIAVIVVLGISGLGRGSNKHS